MEQTLLTVENISVYFKRSSKSVLEVLSDVSVHIAGKEVLGIVGESGCGKTTLARVIMQLIEPQSGSVVLEGINLTALPVKKRRLLRSHMQMIFQDPYASLNPRMTVLEILAEPLRYHRKLKGRENLAEVLHLMEQVGIPAGYLRKYPHEFSGGQRQRIAIARALAVQPSLIIADEPVSALDVSVQAQILNLLADLRRSMDLAMLFISHDLSVVRFISDRIAVMFKGKIVECGPAETVFAAPAHPYTQALIAAVPVPDPDYTYKECGTNQPDGSVTISDSQCGCPYAERCLHVKQQCLSVRPVLEPFGSNNHTVACVRAHEINLDAAV
jgi:oligopeptide/dipeptide ABC transporter ATP-binding protein